MDSDEGEVNMDTMGQSHLQHFFGVTMFQPQTVDFREQDMTEFVLLSHVATIVIDARFCGLDITGISSELNSGRQRSAFQLVINCTDNGLQSVTFFGLFPGPILSHLMLVPVSSVIICSESGCGGKQFIIATNIAVGIKR